MDGLANSLRQADWKQNEPICLFVRGDYFGSVRHYDVAVYRKLHQAVAERRIGGALYGIVLFDDIYARANSAWGGLCHMERAWRVHRRFTELLSAQSEFELASCARFAADCHRCDIGQ